MGYTNHTLLPEALEKWPVEMPTNGGRARPPCGVSSTGDQPRRFLHEGRREISEGDDAPSGAHSDLIEEGPKRMVRMAYVSIVGSHSTNGVAALHTELLKKDLLPDFFAMFPGASTPRPTASRSAAGCSSPTPVWRD